MFTQQGPGGVYYSAIQQEPEMHPLIELGASLAPYAAGAYAIKHYSDKPYVAGSEYSSLDIFQKRLRNLTNMNLFGIFNTFRFSELLSSQMSSAGLGLEKTKSLLDGTSDVGRYVFDAKYLTNDDTHKVLKSLLGEDAFGLIDTRLKSGDETFQLVYEQTMEGRGQGRLFFQELQETTEEVDGVVKFINVPRDTQPLLLAEDLRVQELPYAADIYDHLENLNKTQKMNPAYMGLLQSLDLKGEVDYTKVFAASAGDKAQFGLVPDLKIDTSSLSAFQKGIALLTAPFSMNINRFNRLLTSTAEQIPFAGKFVGDLANATGLSLKVAPDIFYKQFLKLGLQASKIGAAYLGLKTIDHYRREFGTAGNLVASAGVGVGVEALYQKMSKEKKLGFGKAGMIAFATQVLAPGFDKGIIEGFATTLKNIDLGRSYVGEYTGISAIRRGIEGVLPGFTDYTTGIALGLGTAALSYSGYGLGFLKREQAGKLTPLDETLSKVTSLGFLKGIKEEIGLMSDGLLRLPPKESEIATHALVSMLNPKANAKGEYNELFLRYNPIAQTVIQDQFDEKTLTPYLEKLQQIIGGNLDDDIDLSNRQIKQLYSFFKDKGVTLAPFIENLDLGKAEALGLEFERKAFEAVKGAKHEVFNVNNSLNISLLNRIEYINETHSGGGVINAIKRRTKIAGAEIYHSFMGATMSGEISTIDKESGEIITKSYDDFAKQLKASPVFRRFGMLTVGVAALHQFLFTGIFGSMEKPEDLNEIYSGQQNVAIKAGRFWEGGGTPYEGNEIRYFRPHAYHLLMTQAREKAVWGEEVHTYSPATRFFLKNFTYHLEEKNYYDRPYPLTSGAFSDVPVLGFLLESTIGQIIKPRKVMHEDELMRIDPDTGEIERAYLQEYGSSADLGQTPPGMPTSPDSAFIKAGELQYQIREIEGLTGYARNYLQKVFTGRENLGTRQFQIASANDIDSTILDFWDMELGGMAFTSEAIRRLLPRPRGEIEKYNPIANSMPAYIPEKFKRGDPYRSIPNGFARLPGEGYAALNPELKGVDPEDYPDIHKYKILADIAPQSRNTIKLKNLLMERRAAGVTTDFENTMLDRIVEMHQRNLAKLDIDRYHRNAIHVPILSDLVSTAYQGAEKLIRKVAAPAEYLIPGGFRPVQKLLGNTRSAIEIYEQERLYGTVNAFWDKHYRDWFRPAMYSAANLLGWSGKPKHVLEREEINERFDKLNFYKFMSLARTATNIKDKNRFLSLAARTRVGVNPMGDALGLYLSLPQAEKKFFDEFSKAQGEERSRILEMIPEDQKKIYEAIWARIDLGERVELSSAQNKALIDEGYLNKQLGVVTQQLMKEGMPGPDWIGWHKDVDINDIKVKYVNDYGGELADYDMWNSQTRRLSRRPYLEDSSLFFMENPSPSRMDKRKLIINKLSEQTGMPNSDYVINNIYSPAMQSRAELYYNDNRVSETMNLASSFAKG